MTDYVIAYPHPHRLGVACFAVLFDPQPGWERRDPYRGIVVNAVALRADEAETITLAEVRAMHEAEPDKTLQQIIDGWRWDRELYWPQPTNVVQLFHGDRA